MKILKIFTFLFFFNQIIPQDFEFNIQGRDIAVAGTALISGIGLSELYKWFTTPKMPNFEQDYQRYQNTIDEARLKISGGQDQIRDTNTLLLSTLNYLSLDVQQKEKSIQESCGNDNLLQSLAQLLDLPNVRNLVGTLELKIDNFRVVESKLQANILEIPRLIAHKKTKAQEKRFKPEQKAELESCQKEEGYVEISRQVLAELKELLPQVQFNHDFLKSHQSFFECFDAAKRAHSFFEQEINFVNQQYPSTQENDFETLICSRFPKDSCSFYHFAMRLGQEIENLEQLKIRLNFYYPRFDEYTSKLLQDLRCIQTKVTDHPKFSQHQSFHFQKLTWQEQKEMEERRTQAKEDKARSAERTAAAKEALVKAEQERNNGLIRDNETLQRANKDLSYVIQRLRIKNDSLSSENSRLKALLLAHKIVASASGQ